jgi:hypothetical protein
LPPGERYEPTEVMVFLRDLTWKLVLRENISNGESRDGPGRIPWRAKMIRKATAQPQRSVISWLPLDGTPEPTAVPQ